MGRFMQSAEPFGTLFLHASWQAALLAVVVALICRVAGKQITSRWQFVLWGVVFVRLACPVLPSSVFSAANIQLAAEADPRPRPAALDNTPVTEIVPRPTHPEPSARVIHDVAPDPREETAKEPVAFVPPVAEPVETKPKFGKPVEAAAEPAELVRPTVFCIWIVITGVLLARFLWRHRRLSGLAGNWRQADDPEVLKLLEGCRRKLGIRRAVRIVLSDRPIGPATFGLVRPRIVLPESLLRSLTSHELRMVLLHELTHVRRLDILWDQLAFVIAAVHWFNPAAWWALARLRNARELASDAAVLGSLELIDVKSYGHLIVNLAARQIAPRPQAIVVGAVGNPRLLHRRIEMIASYRKPSWKQSVLGAAVLCTLVLCGLTSAQSPEPSENTSPAKADSEKIGLAPAQEEQQPAGQEYIINGTCTDEDKRPLDDVRVRLFRVEGLKNSRDLVKEIQTDADGTFHFANLPAPRSQESTDSESAGVYYDTYYVLAATKSGRTSRLNAFLSSKSPTKDLSIPMAKAGTLSGRVTDEEGRPVKEAEVYVNSYPPGLPIEGAFSDTTGADGRYSINDLTPWDADKQEPEKVGENTFSVTTHCYFIVRHPNYGTGQPFYTKIPSTVDVTLKPGAIIEGQVIDRKTGKPAEAIVSMQGIGETNGYQQATTDKEGKYRLTSVAAGQYNIWADAEERTCIAIDSLEVEGGKTYSNQDIPLVEGGWLEGRIVDARTGEPISEVDGQGLRVASYGPARPKSGAAVVSAPVDKNGRFGLRVGPGKNFPYIMTSEVWQRTEDAEKYKAGIEVGDGELVVLELKVLPERPHKKPVFSPVRLSIPVAEEREAAAAIRRLGGWYQLNEEKHVAEVNMVYHYTNENARHDNDQKDTDEALKWLPKFPRLKRLFLKENQASDESMRHVAELSNLETFFVWEAHKLTDAGVRHLAKLTKLKEIHISKSQISDGTLEVFGGLPNLERLSLQGNHFTDAGVPHLAELKNLKSLWIGRSQGELTENIAPHLARLTSLEELDLQKVRFTDEGVAKLKPLTRLRQLYLHGADAENHTITNASLEVLIGFPGIESLMIQNCRMSDEAVKELAALPKLKRLSLEGTSISQETKAELQKKYPGRWINLPLKSR